MFILDLLVISMLLCEHGMIKNKELVFYVLDLLYIWLQGT